MVSSIAFIVRDEGLRTSSRVRSEDRGTIHNIPGKVWGFSSPSWNEFDWMITVGKNVPADFWSMGLI